MKQSAGILLYRFKDDTTEYFLVHPGGPFFARKDAGWWTIPKGELMDNEEPLQAAIREFTEETGYTPEGDFIPLTTIKQKGGKQVICWANEGDLKPEEVSSNTFDMIWPPRSGKTMAFPEIDKAGWFDIEAASILINERQVALLEKLAAILAGR